MGLCRIHRLAGRIPVRAGGSPYGPAYRRPPDARHERQRQPAKRYRSTRPLIQLAGLGCAACFSVDLGDGRDGDCDGVADDPWKRQGLATAIAMLDRAMECMEQTLKQNTEFEAAKAMRIKLKSEALRLKKLAY
jgi:hypothetical protein